MILLTEEFLGKECVTPGSQQHSNGWPHTQSIKSAQNGINELLNLQK